MKFRSSTHKSGVVSLRLLAILASLCLVPLLVFAAAPQWWSDRGVLNPTATPNDYAAANQGQVKNIAKAAAAEFDATLPGGAGNVLHTLVAGWSSPTSQANNYAAINLGQLKNLAKPFYDRLIAVSYVDAYPWTGFSNSSNDYAVANIGQVKNLFSFNLRSLDVAHDMDSNGLADWWERYYFGIQA